MNSKKHIIVIGAGPGGLSAAMVLAHRGHRVTILERMDVIGGRNAPLRFDGFTFETGPTFVMLPQVFDEIFSLAGRKRSDYLEFIELDPLYRLRFSDGLDFHVHFDKTKLRAEIDKLFPGESAGYDRWYAYNKKKFEKVYDCLKIPYSTPWSFFNPKLLKALPYLQAHRSLWSVLGDFFHDENLKISMTFQAKYLGMSPKTCPGTFSILSYTEHAYGVFHPKGGVHMISEAMAKVAREDGAEIRLSTEVKRVVLKDGQAKAVELADGTILEADAVVMNADMADGLMRMVDNNARPTWNNKKLSNAQYSCSTFMLYLGLRKQYHIPHHNIIFGMPYHENLADIFERKSLPADPAYYLHNPVVTDAESYAPAGKSALYVLVPVPNLTADIDWAKEKQGFRDRVIKSIETRTELKDLSSQIEAERIITPADWRDTLRVYNGATFNLAHSLSQMLYFRPHNQFDNVPGLYLVGGGTHPGSGLPTIVESGRIAADLIG